MKDAIKPTFSDPILQERLAKYLVQQCFAIQYWKICTRASRPVRRLETTQMSWSVRPSKDFRIGCCDLMMPR